MTAIYLLRHPQTTWNAEQRYQGRLEAPLSSEGKLQSSLVARAFHGCDLDAVYSSPLGRAQYLAREVAQATDAPVCTDHRLTEMGQGPWEGLYLSQIRSRFPDLYRAWYESPDTVEYPGWEGIKAVLQRATSTVADIQKAFPLGNVAIVTHSVVVQAVVSAALSLSLRNIHAIRVSNASVTTLCGTMIEGSLLSLNSTSPLYASPVAAATAQGCAEMKLRRLTS